MVLFSGFSCFRISSTSFLFMRYTPDTGLPDCRKTGQRQTFRNYTTEFRRRQSAPAGYKKLESDITFKLVPDETSQIGYILTDSSGNELTDSMLSISKEDKTVVLRLKNDQGAVLPETGGTGFLSPLTLCGIMAMAFVLATAVMYGFSVRRGERRYE